MRRSLLAAFTLALLAGCGGGTPLSVAVDRSYPYAVTMDVELDATTGDVAHPVSAVLHIANRGIRDVLALYGCSSPDVAVLDADGNEVFLRDPRAVLACADYLGVLTAGSSMSWGPVIFSGQLYRANGDLYDAPGGTYTVVARFAYGKMPSAPLDSVAEDRATFTWSAP